MRAALHAALCVLVLYALWEIYSRGYPTLCILLMLPAAVLLQRSQHEPMLGVELCFHRGVWTLQGSSMQRPINPGRRCVVTPWVIYLSFTEPASGAMRQLWLYVDAVNPQQWRRLRVRLTLLH